jgi:hypothetical protein
MPSTYLWSDAVTFVGKYTKGVPTSALDPIAVDTVDAIMHRFWFWKWTMANLTPIPWVNNQQDYTILDANFYRLYRARFRRTDVSPVVVREKNVANFLSVNLEQTGGIDSILAVSYNYELGKLRLDKAAQIVSPVAIQTEGDYQFQHVKITTTATTVVFPDAYLDVAIAGLTWKYFSLISSPQAGTLQVDKQTRAVVYTGQLGVFYSALQAMAEAEGMGQGDSSRFPDDPLGVGRSTNPGLFAWS